MSNNLDITIHDFENICRTCLSREDLKPLYGKYLVDMLMACTFVKFREDDGLPGKICTNCIDEISQAISFANRCEATDTILRKCVKKFETELANKSSQSQKDEQISKAQEEIILPNMHRTVKEILKQDVKHEEELIIEKSDEAYDEHAIESYEEDVYVQDETNSEKSNSGRKSTNSQIKEDGSSNFSKTKPKLPYYECKKCFEMFTDFEVLKKHRDAKHSPNFSRKSNLDQHKNTQHSEPSDQKLKTYQKLRTGEEKNARPYACHVCGKAFNKAKTLKQHKRLHTGEKPYVCSVCSKAFTQRSGLKLHMRLHTGEKPCICEVCNKAFAQSAVLNYHMRRLHNVEKTYNCEVCSKAFPVFHTLKRHMRIHTGEKPYSCEVCSRAFAQNFNLKMHMRIHTGEPRNLQKLKVIVYKRTHGEQS